MLEPDNGLDEQRGQLEQTFSDIGLDDERPAQAVKRDGGVTTAFSDEKELSQVDDRRQDEHDTQTTAVHALPTAGEGASGSSVHLTADHLLDDLDGSKEAATGPLAQTVAARQTSHYDQFFEEVSLDLPRDSYMPAAGKTTRFPYLPRGRGMSATATASTSTPTTASSGSPHAKDMAITSADISGPFYSISDVLDDSAIDHPADDYTARGAQRNIYEQNIVVTSGGANLTGIQRRSSLNLFSRPRRSQKPSPLETVVSKTRPRMLPPKDPSEEKKHLQQHEALMKKARKLEEKKVKEHERKKEQVDKRVAQAISVWEHTILPQWDQKIKEKKTHDLWRQGVPPRCRRNVWILAIGNHLQLSKESFVGCLREVPLGPTNGHATHETPASTRRRIVEDQENSFYQQKRRTSSLHVLHENEDEDVSLASGPTASSESLPMARGSLDHATPVSPGGATMDDGSDMQNVDLDDLGDQHSVLGRASMAIEDDTVDDDDNDDAKYSPTGARTNTGAFIHDTTTLAYLRKAVDEDILRTLPSLCVFQPEGPLFVSLRKVLHAYIGYRADANYTRGASFLAGMLLLNMNMEDAFIALINMIDNSPVLSALYRGDEARVKGYFKVFNILFAEHMPKLYLHFKNLALLPDNYLPDWFMTLFASITPLGLSSRIWDIFLLEGDVALFKAGLTMLKYLEPLLWGGGFSETVRTLNLGFVGTHRGEEAKAAIAVSGDIAKGEQDLFFQDMLGTGKTSTIHLDHPTYNTLVKTHVSK